jgi:probable F420-dependent oxidoreductase
MARQPFRFGILAFGAPSADEWRRLARKAEELGYATFLVADHVHLSLAPIAALIAAAEATATIRVGSYVFANDFRHPVLLAKEAASIDVLSVGRLELGLGTGFWRADYEQLGLPLDPPGVRLGRLEEALQIIKGAFSSREPFSFTGTHYTVKELTFRPTPLQRPRPPIAVGGGSRRVLSLAAREADIVTVNTRTTPDGRFDLASRSAEAFAQGIEWVRRAAGGRFAEIELSVLVGTVRIADEAPRALAARLLDEQRAGPLAWSDPDELVHSPTALLGSVDAVVDTLVARREALGFSYPVIGASAMDAFAPVVARLAGK